MSQDLLTHVSKLASFSPRTPSSAGSAAARAYLTEQLLVSGRKALPESFLASTPAGSLVMTNLCTWNPAETKAGGRRIILLGTHYDSKAGMPAAFQAANDGASGCAVLLELARISRGKDWAQDLEFLFLDGEEAMVQYSPADGLFGSREFVRKRKAEGKLSVIGDFILIDMVGDRDLHFRPDPNSAPGLRARIWSAGERAGLGGILSKEDLGILDDHIPFIQEGVSACVLIDLDYGPGNSYWHTTGDRVEHVSGNSMAKTLRLLEAYLSAERSP